MDLDGRVFIHLAITFELSLQMHLHNEIGLNSSKLIGLSNLGTRAIEVDMKAVIILPETPDSLRTLKIFSYQHLIKSQKHSIGHPSRLGFLSFLKNAKSPEAHLLLPSPKKLQCPPQRQIQGTELPFYNFFYCSFILMLKSIF